MTDPTGVDIISEGTLTVKRRPEGIECLADYHYHLMDWAARMCSVHDGGVAGLGFRVFALRPDRIIGIAFPVAVFDHIRPLTKRVLIPFIHALVPEALGVVTPAWAGHDEDPANTFRVVMAGVMDRVTEIYAHSEVVDDVVGEWTPPTVAEGTGGPLHDALLAALRDS